MARPFTPKIVTANALLEGDVIYRNASGDWVRALSEAELYDTVEAADAALAVAAADNFAVGAYLVDAVASDDGPAPTHFREEFRRTGPSNYFHGKQADTSTSGGADV